MNLTLCVNYIESVSAKFVLYTNSFPLKDYCSHLKVKFDRVVTYQNMLQLFQYFQ